MKKRGFRLAVGLALVVAIAGVGGVAPAGGAPTELFFSEYIEGTSNNKALEIYNGTGAAIDLGTQGYNVQMYFNGSSSAGLTINLVGTVANGDVFVLAHSSAAAAILAQADQTNGAGWFNGDDAVVLRKGTTVIDVIGQIGFDPGTEWGSGLASTADNTLRRKPAIEAGDPNGSDAFDPSVEWDGFATDTFDGLGAHTTTGGDTAPTVTSTTPAGNAVDVALDANVEITFSEDVTTSGNWFSIDCATTGVHAATASGGPRTYTLDAATDFGENETCTVTITGSHVSDTDTDDPPDTMAADHTWSFSTPAPTLRIHEIQGAGHLSPYAGERTSFVPGVVVVVRNNGFWMQDAQPDGDPATSEGIFVFTSTAPTVARGHSVTVTGLITEFRPGGAATANLTTTELERVTVYPGGPGAAIAPTVVGAGGRVPPTEVIDNDSTGSVETSGTFDPSQDGIDFYESLEGMLLQVNDAVVVGPRNSFGEAFVVGDNGADAGVRTIRGGILVRDVDPATLGDYRNGDFNPERIQLDDVLAATPVVNVGDRIPGATVGVLSYDFGNFELLPLTAPVAVSGGLQREVTEAPHENELAVATFNVENLDPSDTAAIPRLARIVVENLRSPDLIGIEEMQDNNGGTNNGVTAADQSWQAFIDAIVAVGGPRYDYRQIDPVNNADGGQPGGNIRVGFLFRSDRGLRFVDRPGGDATTPTGVFRHDGGAHLTLSPGRVDPLDPAWADTRKPLAGEFVWKDKTIIAIVNHFSSKGGDDPLFGHRQPPVRVTEEARHAQAASVNAFVDRILAAERKANVIVLGDINDFEFSETTEILEGGVLTSLIETLPQNERYSYVFEGNSQVLDQILYSDNMLRGLAQYDVVHVNAEFADQASDHEPSVARGLVLGGGGGGS